VIAEPPLLTGVSQVATKFVVPGVRVSEGGAVGGPMGVPLLVVAAPSPAALIALTESVYATPLSSPLICSVRMAASRVLSKYVDPPDVATRWYSVSADPPSLVGAVQVTWKPPSCTVALTLAGAPGTVRGVPVTTDEYGPEPPALFAATFRLY
jgi:hypothetical protein